ncbi:WhiB family transcriptional regulator [Streptomyces sp. NPDC001493]
MNNRNWRARAACSDPVFDPEMWHPVGTSPAAQQQAADAKSVCYRCPVVDACLRWALDQREDVGIWGGLDEDERRRIHRRKTPAAAPAAPRTFESVLDAHSQRTADGHVTWSGGSNDVSFKNRSYTPTQLAWMVAYGGPPEGRISVDCGHPGCINPDHLLDAIGRLGRHGTAAAHKAHERRGEDPCAACKAGRRNEVRAARRRNTERSAA